MGHQVTAPVEFFVPMPKPVGKARARVTSRGTFTPAATKAAERKVQAYAKGALRFLGLDRPLEGQLMASIDLNYPIPASWSQKRRLDALSGSTRPTVRPDADNAAKLVLDACNGLIYRDDAQIVSLRVEKWYVHDHDAGVRVVITPPRRNA